MRFVFPHLKSRTGVILLCNLVKRGVTADLSGVQTLWKVENVHPLEVGWLSNYTRLGLVKLVHILKTSAPLTRKIIACKTWTMPTIHSTPPLLQKRSWTLPTPTPSTGRRSNHFIVNLLLYGRFITKRLPLSSPPDEACTSTASHTRNTRGRHFCHQRTLLGVTAVQRAFTSTSSVKNLKTSISSWDNLKYSDRNHFKE